MTTTKNTTAPDDLGTLDAEALAALIAAGDDAAATAEAAATEARTSTQAEEAEALAAADAARAELARRRQAEEDRLTRRRRAHAHYLTAGGGFEALTAEVRAEHAAARQALADALAADPVLTAYARLAAVEHRAGPIVDTMTAAHETLGEDVPSAVANYRAPSAPSLASVRDDVLRRLTTQTAEDWRDALAESITDVIAGDSPSLDHHVETAAERHARNEAERVATLAEFKQRETVEPRVTYLEDPSLPYLHRAVTTWHDMFTGESLPEDAPNDPSRGVVGIIAEHGRHVPLPEVTGEDVASAIAAGTITETAAALHDLPAPVRRR